MITNLKAGGRTLARLVAGVMILAIFNTGNWAKAGSESAATTNTFPSVPEVLGGRTFENFTEQDIYFMRSIHDRYHDHWSDLLAANLTLNDFTVAPEKLLRFVTELGEAMRGKDDPDAWAQLSEITGDPTFYANKDVSRPEIIKAAAKALIKMGPAGRKALLSTFSVEHYRTDPGSLEILADAVGEERVGDVEFVTALTAVAFSYTTTNGAFYPHCVTCAVSNLLSLTNGLTAVQGHLKIEEILNNPGLFQGVVDGVVLAHADGVTTNLAAIQPKIESRLKELAGLPGGYRDDLQELRLRIERALIDLGKKGNK
jgi:hypothetical protein